MKIIAERITPHRGAPYYRPRVEHNGRRCWPVCDDNNNGFHYPSRAALMADRAQIEEASR